MHIQLSLSTGEPLDFTNGYPDDYRGKILAGANSYSLHDPAASIVIQEYIAERYSLRYTIARFLKKIVLKSACRNPGYYVRLMLQEGLTHRIKELGRIHIKEGGFLIVYAGSGECLVRFDKNKEYQYFDLFFSGQYVDSLNHLYPHLTSHLNTTKPVVKLIGSAQKTDQSILAIINELLSAPYNKDTSQLFNEEKVQDLFNLLFDPASLTAKIKLHRREVEALHEVKMKIEENYTLHFSTQQISKEFGINEFKLKAGFRQLFGMGLFDCLIRVRMEKALELIRDDDLPIKQIASLVGYKRLPAFVTAFKKYFGKPPGQTRFKK